MQDSTPSPQTSAGSAADERPPLRRHLIFLDGTWNSDGREGEQTHIVRLRNRVAPKVKADGKVLHAQTIYYDAGVGTGWTRFDRFLGGAIGLGLDDNVRQAYRHLSGVYEPGDQICVFGFSRGAYTARSLVGYIGAAGLLRRDSCTPAAEAAAWAYYRTPPKDRSPGIAAAWKKAVHPDVRVRAMGIFDTVGSLGIPVTWLRWVNLLLLQFHDTEVSRIVDYAFHALALDERREPFQAAVWQQPRHEDFEKIEQVWFPGVHSDIGGGYPDHELGDIPLRWMIDRLTRGPGTENGPHVHFYELEKAPKRVSATGAAVAPAPDRNQLRSKKKPALALDLSETGEEASDSGVDRVAAAQHESRTRLYRELYRRPLLRLVNQTWLRGDKAELRRDYVINEFQPFQAPIGEMVHWSGLARLGRKVEVLEGGKSVKSSIDYAPPNLVAVLPNILITYLRDGDTLSGHDPKKLAELKALADRMRSASDPDMIVRDVRLVRHVADEKASDGWRVQELDPNSARDCTVVLRQLLRPEVLKLLLKATAD